MKLTGLQKGKTRNETGGMCAHLQPTQVPEGFAEQPCVHEFNTGNRPILKKKTQTTQSQLRQYRQSEWPCNY